MTKRVFFHNIISGSDLISHEDGVSVEGLNLNGLIEAENISQIVRRE